MKCYITYETMPSNIKNAIKKAIKMVDDIMPIYQNIEFGLCTGKSRNGYCRQIGKNDYVIRVNKTMIHEQDIIETTIHEILHSFPDTFNDGHMGKWRDRASRIYRVYGILIQRCNNREKEESEFKYIFRCPECGCEWKYMRKPKWYNEKTGLVNAYCPKHHARIERVK